MSRHDDFDGDGRAELLVSSPWGIGLLEMLGSAFNAPMMAPNGTRFGGWNLQTGDNRFGPVGDFDGDGQAEIVFSSPWGLGVLEQRKNTFAPLMMAPNSTRLVAGTCRPVTTGLKRSATSMVMDVPNS